MQSYFLIDFSYHLYNDYLEYDCKNIMLLVMYEKKNVVLVHCSGRFYEFKLDIMIWAVNLDCVMGIFKGLICGVGGGARGLWRCL